MPRYFFHVRDGTKALDDTEGEILSGPAAAELKAAQIASELAIDGETYRGYRVIVTNEAGEEIANSSIVAFAPLAFLCYQLLLA